MLFNYNFFILVINSSDENSKDSFVSKSNIDIVKLPENLPGDIVDIINNIKDLANTTWEGKVKFFGGPVQKLLLRLFFIYFICIYYKFVQLSFFSAWKENVSA